MSSLYYQTCLQHHGILGMKWGVRRYQNYDGTYTQKGLERYRKAESNYKTVKEASKSGNASKRDVKKAKKELNTAYDKLKKDNMADKGKELYSEGKTISENASKSMKIKSAAFFGSAIAYEIQSSRGNTSYGMLSAALISLGAAAADSVLRSENKKLRAYYAH